jgi:hypothetical protein
MEFTTITSSTDTTATTTENSNTMTESMMIGWESWGAESSVTISNAYTYSLT